MERDIGHHLRRLARPLLGTPDLAPLIDLVGDARYVLLGEASHGTSQFYRWRAAITQELVAHHGFSFVAVEGDWPDCMRVNRYVREHDPAGIPAAIRAFECFDRASGDGAGRDDGQRYGLRARFVRETCEDEVARLLADLRRREPAGVDPEDRFDADQNALVLW